MYDKRIKVFIIVIASLLGVCVGRLVQLQLVNNSSYREKIAELKRRRGHHRQLRTVRGQILDRKGKVLAADEPHFQVHINYSLSCYFDERVRRAKLLEAAKKKDPQAARAKVREHLQDKYEDVQQVIEKCAYFGLKRTDVEQRIRYINDEMWNLRTFLAWYRNDPDPDIIEKYKRSGKSILRAEAIAAFEKKFTDEERFLLVSKVNDIREMNSTYRLFKLETDNDIFTAQLEFMDFDGIEILAKPQRFYPYKSVAAQIIGWVGPATQPRDRRLFAEDRLSSYLEDEVCGREDGVEYVCEAILRGRRGEIVYDIDKKLVERTETQFGGDVALTLDIELQQEIENYLAVYDHEPNCGPGIAAVVIEVGTGDILALVSMPNFDLNRVRYDYKSLVQDSNKPLINRAIYALYPAGSVVKPVILIAGLESGKTTPAEVISCPAKEAPKDWPNCWIYNQFRRGHDDQWQNNARNAIKGSCNIYFSRLADRLAPSVLQRWLSEFGYGSRLLASPGIIQDTRFNRTLREAPGIISSTSPGTKGQIPLLKKSERRQFGIGQGNLRVTPLHVANAMAVIARGGVYKPPSFFVSDADDPTLDSAQPICSAATLDVVRDGMSAVVNDYGGTAYAEFAHSGFAEQGVKVFGKTGSTEAPENAWFAGFAEDRNHRSISIAVVVEGGEHGSRDAAPLARDIIQFCIDAQYIGQNQIPAQ